MLKTHYKGDENTSKVIHTQNISLPSHFTIFYSALEVT